MRGFVSSVYFIYSDEKGKARWAPCATEDVSTGEKIDQLFAKYVKQSEQDGFNLEMIMYSQEAERDDGEVIMFGAMDISGATVHTVYKKDYDEELDGPCLTQTDLENESLNTWIPKEESEITKEFGPVIDEFLNVLMARYAVAASLARIFK